MSSMFEPINETIAKKLGITTKKIEEVKNGIKYAFIANYNIANNRIVPLPEQIIIIYNIINNRYGFRQSDDKIIHYLKK